MQMMASIGQQANQGGNMPMPTPMQMPMPMSAAFNVQGDANNTAAADLEGAQKTFLEQARAARSEGSRVWGPGGTGGITGQRTGKQQLGDDYEYVTSYVSRKSVPTEDPYALDHEGDDRFLAVEAKQFGSASSSSPPRAGSHASLMEAATQQGIKLVGEGEFGKGYSEGEVRELRSRFNEEDALQK
jgi:hypothetical protein